VGASRTADPTAFQWQERQTQPMLTGEARDEAAEPRSPMVPN